MWTREELKLRAKGCLRNYFWAAVVVALVAGIFNGSFSRGSSSNNVTDTSYNKIQESGQSVVGSGVDMIFGDGASAHSRNIPGYLIARIASTGFGVMIMGLGVLMVIFGIALGILVGNPIQVGANRFFMCAREQSTRIGEMFYAFRKTEFWNVVLIMLVMNVKIFLWSLLFVIPGIVKSYEYKMVPYILAENPGIAMSEAFALSREMTDGEKMNIFVLDLSFILWDFLSALTCGICGVLWVNPYKAATEAELYAMFRERVLDSGVTNGYTLPGFGEYEGYR